ncbi:MAG: IS3 family transposase [Bacteroidales bacterium]|nr:IS3 family transposase [Bacteroidales bacterium]
MNRSTYLYRLGHLDPFEADLKQRYEATSIFHESSGCYGHRKITAESARRGTRADKKTVARIMKEEASGSATARRSTGATR